MGLDGALPMALVLMMVCADPVVGASVDSRSGVSDSGVSDSGVSDSGQEEGQEEGDLRAALTRRFLSGRQVVASSPVPAGIGVGSHYGERTSTRTGRRTFHAGTDFLSPRGTPVFAVRHGVVEAVTSESSRTRRWAGYGNAVVIRHGQDGHWSFYAHLDSVDVVPGQVVVPGQKLGAVGNTTNGRFPRMIPHLHLEVRRAASDGSSPFPGGYGRHNVDPERWLAEMGVELTPFVTASTLRPRLVVRPRPSGWVAASEAGAAVF